MSMMMSLRLAFLRFLLRAAGLFAPSVHYIHGADTLPPPLTREREAELLARLPSRDAAVRDELIEHNLRLVVYIARKYESSGIGVEDLISIGSIGLIKAINSFQPAKGIKLATYASRCIENEILMTLRKTHNLRHDISIDAGPPPQGRRDLKNAAAPEAGPPLCPTLLWSVGQKLHVSMHRKKFFCCTDGCNFSPHYRR